MIRVREKNDATPRHQQALNALNQAIMGGQGADADADLDQPSDTLLTLYCQRREQEETRPESPTISFVSSDEAAKESPSGNSNHF